MDIYQKIVQRKELLIIQIIIWYAIVVEKLGIELVNAQRQNVLNVEEGVILVKIARILRIVFVGVVVEEVLPAVFVGVVVEVAGHRHHLHHQIGMIGVVVIDGVTREVEEMIDTTTTTIIEAVQEVEETIIIITKIIEVIQEVVEVIIIVVTQEIPLVMMIGEVHREDEGAGGIIIIIASHLAPDHHLKGVMGEEGDNLVCV